jgi:hypothetical protein
MAGSAPRRRSLRLRMLLRRRHHHHRKGAAPQPLLLLSRLDVDEVARDDV